MNVGHEQRTTVWSLHICLPWSLVTKERSTAVSLRVWSPAVQGRWKMREPSLPGVFWNRARLSLSGALCSARSFTLFREKKKAAFFQGPLGERLFRLSQISPGWEPGIWSPPCLQFPTSSLVQRQRVESQAPKDGTPKTFQGCLLSIWKCDGFSFGPVSCPNQVTWRKSLPFSESHFPHPYNLEGRLDDTRFSYLKCQQSTWENVRRKSSTRGSVKNCFPGSWESHVYLPALASACGFPLPTSCFPLVAWLLSHAKHSAWWWERMLYKTNTPLLSVDLCLVGKVAQEWNN